MKLMGYRFVTWSELGYAMQIGVLTATCRRKLSRGALAVGYSSESDANYCEVEIRDGKDVSKPADTCLRGSVNLWYRDGHCARCL